MTTEHMTIWRLQELHENNELSTLSYDELSVALINVEGMQQTMQRLGTPEFTVAGQIKGGKPYERTLTESLLEQIHLSVLTLLKTKGEGDD